MVSSKMVASKLGNKIDFRELLQNIRSSINVLMLQAISVVTVFIIWMAIKYNMSNSLTLHICFATAGYGFLMTESILLFSGDNFFGRTISRYHKVILHGVFIGSGSVLALAGISIEINGRGTEWPHFQSTHSILGLTSMILMILACLGGVAASHVIRISNYVTFIRPIWWKIGHNFIGQAAYALGILSMCYGFDSWWFTLVATWEQRISCVAVLGVVGIWTIMGPMLKQIEYIKSVFDS